MKASDLLVKCLENEGIDDVDIYIAATEKEEENILDVGIGEVEARDSNGFQAGFHLLDSLLVGTWRGVFRYSDSTV
jgi:hypothetical protein